MQRMQRFLRALVIAAGILLALPHPAIADATVDRKRAAELFSAAQAAFARGEHAQAARGFEDAAALAPHPATVLNAAEAWELAGDFVRAALACDRVLESTMIDPKFREAAAARLARISPQVATVEINSHETVQVSVDGGPSSETRKVRVTPGRHVLRISSARGQVDAAVDVAGGSTKHVDGNVPAPAPTSTAVEKPPVREASSGPPVASFIAFGTGVAAAGAGTFFGFRTLSAKSAFDAEPTSETRDDFYSNRTATNVAFTVALVAVAAGVVLWLVQPSTTQRTSAELRVR